jgi:hypothetical protein
MKMNLAVVIMVTGIAVVALGNQFTPAPMDEGSASVFTGIVRDVNVEARTIVVEAASNRIQFAVAPDAEIIVKDKSKSQLSDIAPGDGVEVHYTEEKSGYVAHQIAQTGLKKS